MAGDPKVGYVPTNLSKKPECQGGELDATINVTDLNLRFLKMPRI